MTGEEKDLLKKYLTHLNVLGKDGSHPHFEAWYQEVRYAQGPNAPHNLMEASELRYKDILDAARVFSQLQDPPLQGLTADRRGWTGLKGWKSSWVSAIPADRGAGPSSEKHQAARASFTDARATQGAAQAPCSRNAQPVPSMYPSILTAHR